MKEKVTAVELLEVHLLGLFILTSEDLRQKFKVIINIAKENEKQQIIDARNHDRYHVVRDKRNDIDGEQYYNETFK